MNEHLPETQRFILFFREFSCPFFREGLRYEHGSIILTSNKYFSDWEELLSDNILATALLDRLLHHAHVVNIRGQTYRLRERWKAGVQPVPPAELPAYN